MGIKAFIENWKKKRFERKRERERLNNLFEQFLLETKPLTPRASKHPEAALLRHAWKRAVIRSFLFKDIPNSEKGYQYNKFAEIAAKRYSQVAPDGPYGKVRLKMTPEAASKLLEKEKTSLHIEEEAEKNKDRSVSALLEELK